MKMIYKVLPKIAFIFLLVWSSLAYSQSIFIYRDFGHKGDENQVRGVISAYSRLKKDIEVKEFNVGEEQKLRDSVNNKMTQEKERPIVLAVGEKTVASCAALFPIRGAITVHLCHMITSNHPQLMGKVDFIATPTHAVGEFANTLKGSKTKLIETIGVAHNRQIEEIEKTYVSDQSKLPKSVAYVGVILGGDAQTPDGKIQLFTDSNVRELARYVAPLIKTDHLLIINGPRTGKYDPVTQEEIKSAHRDGKKDYVTQAFLEELEQSGVTPKQYTLFDFQFGTSTPKDMDLVLGALRGTNGQVLVPGESTSSISESIDVLARGAVIVYDTTSMNPVHTAHVNSEFEVGRIKYLQMGYRMLAENKKVPNNPAQNHTAAETIALKLFSE